MFDVTNKYLLHVHAQEKRNPGGSLPDLLFDQDKE